MTRARTVRDLVVPTVRSIRWAPILGSVLAGFVAYEIARPKFAGGSPVPPAIRAMRISMVMFALGIPFLLDDPSEETVASASVRLSMRRALRVALAVPLIVASWFLLVRYAHYTLDHLPTFSEEFTPPPRTEGGQGIPVWGLARQFLALATAALALSALAARWLPERIGSVAAGPALLAIVGATTLLPAKLTLFVSDPILRRWADAGTRWTIALVVALIWLVHLCRDPGRSRWRARLHATRRRAYADQTA